MVATPALVNSLWQPLPWCVLNDRTERPLECQLQAGNHLNVQPLHVFSNLGQIDFTDFAAVKTAGNAFA
jgi:hypothetical protein